MAFKFAKVKKSTTAKNSHTDRLPGSKFIPSSVIDAVIKKPHLVEAKSGAYALKCDLVSDEGTVRFCEYFISGDAKGNKTYYVDKDGSQHDLPGYSMVNELLISALGEDCVVEEDNGDYEIMDIIDFVEYDVVEEQSLMFYDYDAGAEVPKTVPVVVPLKNAKVKVGVKLQYEDIPVKGKDNKYVLDKKGKTVPSGKCKQVNVVAKFANHETGQTYSEFVEDKEPKFMDSWANVVDGVVFDATANGIAPKEGESASSNKGSDSESGGIKKLFGKKK